MQLHCFLCGSILYRKPWVDTTGQIPGIYCSERCAFDMAARSIKMQASAKICARPGCGVNISHMRSDAKFCSPSCRTASKAATPHRAQPRISNCLVCGADISHKKRGAKFCSPSHQVKYWQQHKHDVLGIVPPPTQQEAPRPTTTIIGEQQQPYVDPESWAEQDLGVDESLIYNMLNASKKKSE